MKTIFGQKLLIAMIGFFVFSIVNTSQITIESNVFLRVRLMDHNGSYYEPVDGKKIGAGADRYSLNLSQPIYKIWLKRDPSAYPQAPWHEYTYELPLVNKVLMTGASGRAGFVHIEETFEVGNMPQPTKQTCLLPNLLQQTINKAGNFGCFAMMPTVDTPTSALPPTVPEISGLHVPILPPTPIIPEPTPVVIPSPEPTPIIPEVTTIPVVQPTPIVRVPGVQLQPVVPEVLPQPQVPVRELPIREEFIQPTPIVRVPGAQPHPVVPEVLPQPQIPVRIAPEPRKELAEEITAPAVTPEKYVPYIPLVLPKPQIPVRITPEPRKELAEEITIPEIKPEKILPYIPPVLPQPQIPVRITPEPRKELAEEITIPEIKPEKILPYIPPVLPKPQVPVRKGTLLQLAFELPKSYFAKDDAAKMELYYFITDAFLSTLVDPATGIKCPPAVKMKSIIINLLKNTLEFKQINEFKQYVTNKIKFYEDESKKLYYPAQLTTELNIMKINLDKLIAIATDFLQNQNCTFDTKKFEEKFYEWLEYHIYTYENTDNETRGNLKKLLKTQSYDDVITNLYKFIAGKWEKVSDLFAVQELKVKDQELLDELKRKENEERLKVRQLEENILRRSYDKKKEQIRLEDLKRNENEERLKVRQLEENILRRGYATQEEQLRIEDLKRKENEERLKVRQLEESILRREYATQEEKLRLEDLKRKENEERIKIRQLEEKILRRSYATKEEQIRLQELEEKAKQQGKEDITQFIFKTTKELEKTPEVKTLIKQNPQAQVLIPITIGIYPSIAQDPSKVVTVINQFATTGVNALQSQYPEVMNQITQIDPNLQLQFANQAIAQELIGLAQGAKLAFQIDMEAIARALQQGIDIGQLKLPQDTFIELQNILQQVVQSAIQGRATQAMGKIDPRFIGLQPLVQTTETAVVAPSVERWQQQLITVFKKADPELAVKVEVILKEHYKRGLLSGLQWYIENRNKIYELLINIPAIKGLLSSQELQQIINFIQTSEPILQQERLTISNKYISQGDPVARQFLEITQKPPSVTGLIDNIASSTKIPALQQASQVLRQVEKTTPTEEQNMVIQELGFVGKEEETKQLEERKKELAQYAQEEAKEQEEEQKLAEKKLREEEEKNKNMLLAQIKVLENDFERLFLKKDFFIKKIERVYPDKTIDKLLQMTKEKRLAIKEKITESEEKFNNNIIIDVNKSIEDMQQSLDNEKKLLERQILTYIDKLINQNEELQNTKSVLEKTQEKVDNAQKQQRERIALLKQATDEDAKKNIQEQIDSTTIIINDLKQDMQKIKIILEEYKKTSRDEELQKYKEEENEFIEQALKDKEIAEQKRLEEEELLKQQIKEKEEESKKVEEETQKIIEEMNLLRKQQEEQLKKQEQELEQEAKEQEELKLKQKELDEKQKEAEASLSKAEKELKELLTEEKEPTQYQVVQSLIDDQTKDLQTLEKEKQLLQQRLTAEKFKDEEELRIINEIAQKDSAIKDVKNALEIFKKQLGKLSGEEKITPISEIKPPLLPPTPTIEPAPERPTPTKELIQQLIRKGLIKKDATQDEIMAALRKMREKITHPIMKAANDLEKTEAIKNLLEFFPKYEVLVPLFVGFSPSLSQNPRGAADIIKKYVQINTPAIEQEYANEISQLLDIDLWQPFIPQILAEQLLGKAQGTRFALLENIKILLELIDQGVEQNEIQFSQEQFVELKEIMQRVIHSIKQGKATQTIEPVAITDKEILPTIRDLAASSDTTATAQHVEHFRQQFITAIKEKDSNFAQKIETILHENNRKGLIVIFNSFAEKSIPVVVYMLTMQPVRELLSQQTRLQILDYIQKNLDSFIEKQSKSFNEYLKPESIVKEKPQKIPQVPPTTIEAIPVTKEEPEKVKKEVQPVPPQPMTKEQREKQQYEKRRKAEKKRKEELKKWMDLGKKKK